MEYIDWIISATVYLMVIVLVISYIPQNLPIGDNSEEVFIANTIYDHLISNTTIYNIKNINNNNSAHIYSFKLDSNDANIGKGDSYSLIENNTVYGVFLNNSNFYNIDKKTKSKGIKIFEENFNDITYNDSFNVTDGNNPTITYDVLKLEADTNISTINTYYDYNANININCFNFNIYFNYDINNTNYAKLEISGNTQDLYDCNKSSSNCKLIDSKNIFKNKEWRKISFGFNSFNKIFATIDNERLEGTVDYDINEGNIIFETIDNITYLDDFKVFKNNDLIARPNIKNIKTNYLDLNINNNDNKTTNINFFENKNTTIGGMDINFSTDLVFPANLEDIKIIKDNTGSSKIIIFPNTTDIILKENKENNLNMELKGNLEFIDYNFYIDQDNDFWTNISIPQNKSKTIYIKKNGTNTSDYNNVFGNDLTAYYSFSNNYNDISPANKNLSEYGTPTFENNRFNENNESLFLDNDDDYLIIPNLKNSNSFTISTWIKLPDDFNKIKYSYLLAKQGDFPQIYLIFNNDTIIFRNFHTNIDSNENDLVVTNNLDLNKWYLLTFTYDFDTTYKKIYINNEQKAQIEQPELNFKILTANIGDYDSGNRLNATIDDFKIYSKALSLEEIQNEFIEEKPTTTIEKIGPEIYKITILNNTNKDINNYKLKINSEDLNINSNLETLDVKDGYNTTNKIHSSKLNIEILNSENLTINDCNINIENNIINIKECTSDLHINLYLSKEVPNIKVNRYTDTIIFEEDLDNLNIDDNYYINLINKGTNIEYGTNRDITTTIIERYAKFINYSGESEVLKVLIKPY